MVSTVAREISLSEPAMATIAELAKRVEALERRVEELASMLNTDPSPKEPWWVTQAGRFKDDPYFEEAARLGAEWRQSQRPKPRKKRKKS
jgi:hypothetical protein